MKMEIEKITTYIDGLTQLTGLPPWVIFTILAWGIIFVYFYLIKFPMSFIRLKREVVKQSEIIQSLITQVEEGDQKPGPRYKWKT
jgi:uncharacterized protein (DUF486 family)